MRKISFLCMVAFAIMLVACSDTNEPDGTGNSNNYAPTKPAGQLEGKFTVADNRQVYFSQGNLQYNAKLNMWRFAINQWDFVGDATKGTVSEGEEKSDNSLIGNKYKGWIDLFGWGTSGYGSKYPYMTSTEELDYLGGGKRDITYTYFDWGVNNAISNGGNRQNTWRTLSRSELYHLFYARSNCENLYGYATIHDVSGVIIFPDGFEVPTNINFTPYTNGQTFSANAFSDDEWSQLEKMGAVFLPAAGYRVGETVYKAGERGLYWSSSYNDKTLVQGTAYYVLFDNTNYISYSNMPAYYGYSVRLVRTIGEEQLNPDLNTIEVPEGAIDAVFTMGNGKRVFFSKGNLQYNVATIKWQFAEHQWDYVGKANESATGWKDLFTWTSDDWGKKMGGKWCTPTKEDWNNLRLRKNSTLFGFGSVNGVKGCIFLPNDWVTPSGLTFVSGVTDINRIDENDGFELRNSNFSNNTYTADQWQKMEKNGAVFIPAGGYQEGSTVKGNGSEGRYWSATNYGDDEAYYYVFSPTYYNPANPGSKSTGQSVRLIYVINN